MQELNDTCTSLFGLTVISKKSTYISFHFQITSLRIIILWRFFTAYLIYISPLVQFWVIGITFVYHCIYDIVTQHSGKGEVANPPVTVKQRKHSTPSLHRPRCSVSTKWCKSFAVWDFTCSLSFLIFLKTFLLSSMSSCRYRLTVCSPLICILSSWTLVPGSVKLMGRGDLRNGFRWETLMFSIIYRARISSKPMNGVI